MNIFKRLRYVINSKEAVDSLIKDREFQLKAESRMEHAHNLHLCKKHKQEINQSHYAEHNCDYCKQEKKAQDANIIIQELRQEKESTRVLLLQYKNLRAHHLAMVKEILGKDYYNMAYDVYSTDKKTCEDIIRKYKQSWFKRLFNK